MAQRFHDPSSWVHPPQHPRQGRHGGHTKEAPGAIDPHPTRPHAPGRPGLGPVDTDPGGPSGAQLLTATATFDLLSVPTRLHLMWLLAHHDYDVSTLAAQVGAHLPAVSHHLAKLRLAGAITARPHGRQKIYTITDPDLIALLDDIFDRIDTDGSLTRTRTGTTT